MRGKLKRFIGRTLEFTATVQRAGRDKWICLTNVCTGESKRSIADHLWVETDENIKPGQRIQFRGKVGTYSKVRVRTTRRGRMRREKVEDCEVTDLDNVRVIKEK